ncbi:putative NADPH-dependent FMN reductase [Mucor lusitanicus]|uniref:Putative NADPH-dependent FMN reductase n=1 Tax=Mucor circinelloides f. lusitanicus TaxID=29924 RepID=A0A8H4BJR9_MUCCL|nr:putative NADPH-dependent FMN reductase [Mucor lusitanicus]
MNIGVIVGSTRPSRIGHQLTKWLLSVITAKDSLNLEIIDLAEWDLPLFNEPEIPAKGEQYYSSEKTRQWSNKIASKDGYIFVTPQYNWGYPASLKNAVDYLYNEWTGKPAIIISYANRGGGKAAAQFRQVLDGLKMRPVQTMPAICLTKDMYTENGKLKEIEKITIV